MISQNLNKIGKSPLFKVRGGVGVNTVFYDGNSNREPFTYFLSGNVNVNISNVYNIPFSFSYSNSKFQTNNPFTFNRLSIHPNYKWVTAHIGDVNMSFSPYTLNGHQFTGLGLDLSPKDKFKISLMYGTLLKEREFDNENLNGEANYRRIGYGFKTSYKFENAKVGAIFFRASDNIESLKNQIPIDREILPKDNTVISFDGEFNLGKSMKLKGEVAMSVLTEDIRVGGESDHFASFLVSGNPTTQFYKAYNLNFVYQIAKGSIGLGYELIDPNYKTLGGYFFNNDLENITVNASQRIFKDKLAINFNAGLQKDDLDGNKASQLRRLVSAVNLAYNASKKLNITAGYSSFQSFTNIKDQFDFINGVSQIEEALDQDNIAQISQNANLNINYNLKESESNRQNINFNFSFQDAVNEIDDKVRDEDSSAFYNVNTVYTIAYPQTNLTLSGALNTSYSELGTDKNIIVGPTASLTKSFLEKKLKVNSSLSYNESINNGERQGNVTNIRVGSRYVYKKQHNFNLTGLFQLRNSLNNSNQNFTLTFGYTYSFGVFNSKNLKFKKRNKKRKIKEEKLREKEIRFKYKDSLYQGTIAQIDVKIKTLLNSNQFSNISESILETLHKERVTIATENKNRVYKVKAVKLLKEAYNSKKYLDVYNELLYQSLSGLYEDIKQADYTTERSFVLNKKEIIKDVLWNLTPKERAKSSKEKQVKFRRKFKIYESSFKKLLVHRWMLSEIEKYDTFEKVKNDQKLFKKFQKLHADEVFKMLKMNDKKAKIKLYLQGAIITFLAKEAEKHIDKDQYELKYMNQN